MTDGVKVAIGVGFALGGLLWLGSRKKTASAAAPPQEQLPACPTGQHRDGLVCVPDVTQPPPLSEDAIAGRELAAIKSTDPAEIRRLADEIRGAGRPTVGLDAWAGEATAMAGPLAQGYAQYFVSPDPITLTRAAAYAAAEGHVQAGANLLAMAAMRVAGPKGSEAIRDAAEKGSVALYGGVMGVASFAVAVEELRAMMTFDQLVYTSSSGGIKAFLVSLTPKIVQGTKGLDGRMAELAAVPLTFIVANGITAAITAGDAQKLKDASVSLMATHKQLAAQLSLLSSLVGSDVGTRVGEIRTLAEAGAP